MTTPPEEELLARFANLYSSLVSDCADDAGLGSRCASPGLQPFHADTLRVVVGRAHTVQARQTTERVEIDILLRMVQATPRNGVVLIASDKDVKGALWGGLMSLSVIHRQGLGAIIDGGVRDIKQIHELSFPVWAEYRSPSDIRGRAEIVSYGTTISFRGVLVNENDLVFADANGVVIIPLGSELDVLERCEMKLETEETTARELAAGADPIDVYRRFGAF
jgi:4-hydroxy-4-methyl-2-oxoglutarate aldolase